MDEQQLGPQKDLFNDISDIDEAQDAQSTNGNTKAKRQVTIGLDKFLIFLLFFLICAAVMYAMGVEKGRKSADVSPLVESLNSTFVKEIRVKSISPVSKLEELEPATEPMPSTEYSVALEEPDSTTIAPVKQTGDYTIQLVTYKSSSYAKNETDKLKNKGYDAFIIPSGEYQQVCVNRYENKDAAQKQLSTFRNGKDYMDAFIRKVNK